MASFMKSPVESIDNNIPFIDYFQRLDSSPIRKMTRLESTGPNDSTRTRLADFCGNWLESCSATTSTE